MERPSLSEANKMVTWKKEEYDDNCREILAAIMTVIADDWSTCYNGCNTSIDHNTDKCYIMTRQGLKEAENVKFGEYDDFEEGSKCSLCP
ncbi:MAG: hypothetical protein PHX34_04445 [Candidatus Shapirobacteria bacterium]|nr:hypothetical protein [Candidatus Shapirobacteria bacterium]